MLLTFEPLWRDYDGMLELRFSVQASGFAAKISFYGCLETIEAFGCSLREFPRSPKDEVAFESDSIALRAFVFDGVGHSALEIECQRVGTRLVSAHSRFAVELEPATINRLGSELVNWTSSGIEQPFVFTSEQ
ncbi:hypothetical protein WCQ02_41125 [Paraburkholderia tropica]|uniref:hypothetical protein n=1 Tax=Paraburkholderia tropica TaxID=92647 RepID=UPI000F54EDE0|nr:hypothetical protein [Paraburkholderia tropica]RQN37189.1 hypothetical protein EHZ25_19745 [Paraburkholderia tropica]